MSSQTKILYSFDSFLLEVSEKRLWKEDELIPLTPKAFETLVVLVSHRGRVVEKNALMDLIWADTFVEEGVLAQNILTLRKALGKSADGQPFIETVPRTGYRFLADVQEIIGDDEIVILERRVKAEITTEQRTASDDNLQTQTAAQTSANLFFNKLRRNKFAILGFAGLLFAASAGIFFAVKYLWPRPADALSRFNRLEISKLTTDGNVSLAVISPDGKYLAFVETRGANQIMQVRQISDSVTVEILPSAAHNITGLAFSPDGNRIYFNVYKKDSGAAYSKGYLYRISMLGGTPQEIVADIDSPPTFSPDGQKIAFVRNHPTEDKSMLVIASNEGKNEQILAVRNLKERFSLSGLAWSPDGRTIAGGAYLTEASGAQMDVLLVDTMSGEQKFLTRDAWFLIGQTAWLADASGVVFPGWKVVSNNSVDEVWLASMDGVTRQVSSGINGLTSLSLSADSNLMAVNKKERLTDLWIADETNLREPSKVLQNLSEFNLSPPGISLTIDGTIVFGSTFNGNLDVWAIKADGTGRRQLTTDKFADYVPTVSNDGQTVLFVSNRTGRDQLWRMRNDGGGQEILTDEQRAYAPSLAPDGRTVFYVAPNGQNNQFILQKLDLETRTVTKLTSLPTFNPRLSPDGRYVACHFPEIKPEGPDETHFKLTILSAETGAVVKQFGSSMYRNQLSLFGWKGPENLTYLTLENGDTKMWQQSLNDEKPRILLEMPQTAVFRFAWSPDGKKLVYEKGTTLNNAFLIRSKE